MIIIEQSFILLGSESLPQMQAPHWEVSRHIGSLKILHQRGSRLPVLGIKSLPDLLQLRPAPGFGIVLSADFAPKSPFVQPDDIVRNATVNCGSKMSVPQRKGFLEYLRRLVIIHHKRCRSLTKNNTVAKDNGNDRKNILHDINGIRCFLATLR